MLVCMGCHTVLSVESDKSGSLEMWLGEVYIDTGSPLLLPYLFQIGSTGLAKTVQFILGGPIPCVNQLWYFIGDKVTDLFDERGC